jgi:GxxExxY protein
MNNDILTEKIIGAAHKVLFALKPGLDEKLYERALIIELKKLGFTARTSTRSTSFTKVDLSAHSFLI